MIIPITVHRDTIVGSVLSVLDVLRPAKRVPRASGGSSLPPRSHFECKLEYGVLRRA